MFERLERIKAAIAGIGELDRVRLPSLRKNRFPRARDSLSIFIYPLSLTLTLTLSQG